MSDDKSLADRLRAWGENSPDPDFFSGDAMSCVLSDATEAAAAIARLTRERDEARAALAQARNDALEEAATWHDYESLMNRAEAGQRGRTDSDYWHFDGLADRHQAYAAAIRAMKREPDDD